MNEFVQNILLVILQAKESAPFFFFTAATVVAVLLGVVVFLVTTIRHRARGLAGKMTEDIASSRELFLELYRNSPVPYLLISYDGLITFPNQAALRFFGVVGGELEGKELFEMLSREGEKGRADILPARFRQGAAIHNEEVTLERKGKTQWALFSVFPFQRERGKHKGLVTFVDITKRKEIEKAKTEFVSLASHQLRTPISSLRWHTELLLSPKSGELNDRQQKEVEAVARGVKRLDTIVEDFLNASRLELGTFEAKAESVNLPSLLDGTLAEVQAIIEKKQLVIQKRYGVDVIDSDPRLLRLVFENLISNAVKYTQPGGQMSLSTSVKDGRIEVTVGDTGRGIPKEEQDKIFSKLFRASNVKEEVPDGTGLGLYTVKMMMEVLGGDIRFRSQENKGTIFTVSLPK